MRPQVITLTLAAASATNIAASQSLAGAGNLLINGSAATAGAATLDTQRQISILSAGNDSGLNWTVTGTNGAGAVISEVVVGGNAVAVSTLQSFKTVTQVKGSGATASTVEVGTNGIGSTPWIIVDPWEGPQQIGFELELLSGAATATIETTMNSPLPPLPIYQPGFSQTPPIPTPFAAAGLSAVAGNTQGAVALTGIAAWRLTVSGVGSWRATAQQTGDWH